MKKLLEILIFFTGFSLFVLIGLLVITESRLPIFEYADTRFASMFNFEIAKQIKLGDSAEQIRNVLGEPLWKVGCGGCWEPDQQCSLVNGSEICVTTHKPKTCKEECSASNQNWEYTDDDASPVWDFAWRQYSVNFKNGKVDEITDMWRYD